MTAQTDEQVQAPTQPSLPPEVRIAQMETLLAVTRGQLAQAQAESAEWQARTHIAEAQNQSLQEIVQALQQALGAAQPVEEPVPANREQRRAAARRAPKKKAEAET